MKKVIVLTLLILWIAGLVQAQDNTLEDSIDLQITDFKTLHADMHIVRYDVVSQGEVLDSYWTEWTRQDLLDSESIELHITDFRALQPDMNVVFYDVVAQDQVIGSQWMCWDAEAGYYEVTSR